LEADILDFYSRLCGLPLRCSESLESSYRGQLELRHAVGFKVNSVGKPDAAAQHVRFDDRGRETWL